MDLPPVGITEILKSSTYTTVGTCTKSTQDEHGEP